MIIKRSFNVVLFYTIVMVLNILIYCVFEMNYTVTGVVSCIAALILNVFYVLIRKEFVLGEVIGNLIGTAIGTGFVLGGLVI